MTTVYEPFCRTSIFMFQSTRKENSTQKSKRVCVLDSFIRRQKSLPFRLQSPFHTKHYKHNPIFEAPRSHRAVICIFNFDTTFLLCTEFRRRFAKYLPAFFSVWFVCISKSMHLYCLKLKSTVHIICLVWGAMRGGIRILLYRKNRE